MTAGAGGGPRDREQLVEAVAEALHDVEYPAWSEEAVPDSNRWSWRGDGHGEQHRERYRMQARAVVDLLDRLGALA